MFKNHRKKIKLLLFLLSIFSILLFTGCPEPPIAALEDITAPSEAVDFTAVPGDNTVTLSWTAPADYDFSGIQLSASPAAGSLAEAINLTGDTNSYTVTGLSNGTTYTFTIKTIDTTGNVSTGITAAAEPGDETPPADVKSFSAASGDGSIILNWTNPPDADFTGVEISASPASGSLIVPVELEKELTSFTVSGLDNGVTYTFTLKAFDAGGNNSVGVSVSAAPADMTPPSEVTGLATAAGNESIVLEWTAPADSDYNGVEISSIPAEGSLSSKIVLDSNTLTYNVTGLTNDTSYIFTVKTLDVTGNKSTGIQTDNVTPSANLSLNLTVSNSEPTNQEITISAAISGGGTITSVKWAVGNHDISWFETNGAALTPNRNVSFTAVSNDNYSLYGADDGGQEVVASITISNIDKTAPAEATGFILSPGDGIVAISWTNPADADFNGVEISASPANGSPTTPVQLGSSAVSYTATGLTNNTEYSFTIITTDTAGNKSTGTVFTEIKPFATFVLSASPSTTEQTNIDVEITGNITGGSDLATVKWTSGLHDAAWFASEGTTLTTSRSPSFIVETNGDYSLYAADDGGRTAVVQITIDNIDKTNPSVVSGLSAEYFPNGERIAVSWTDPADSDLDQVLIRWRKDGDSYTSIYVDAGVQSCNITSITADDEEYEINATSLDEAGNYNISADIQVRAWLSTVGSVSIDREHLDTNMVDRDIEVSITGTRFNTPNIGIRIRFDKGPDTSWKTATLDTTTTASCTVTAPVVKNDYHIEVELNGSTATGVTASFRVTDPANVTDVSLDQARWIENTTSKTINVTITGTNFDIMGTAAVKVWLGASEISSHAVVYVDDSTLTAVIDVPQTAGDYDVQVSFDGTDSGTAELLEIITYEEFTKSVVDVTGATVTEKATYNVRSGGPFSDVATTPVTVEAFKIGTCEVTYAFWHEVKTWAGSNGYTFDNDGREGDDGATGAAPTTDNWEPVTKISWLDAIVWCNALSEMNGKTAVYYADGTYSTVRRDSTATVEENHFIDTTADGYRLPMTAEWEFAARGGDPTNSISWNYYYSGSSTANSVAWYSDNSNSHTHDVVPPLKLSNTLSLYDMSGNAAEFTQEDPSSGGVSCRGGYYDSASGTNSELSPGWYEGGFTASDATNYIGFRIAANAD